MPSNIDIAKDKLRRKEHKELVNALSTSNKELLSKVEKVISGRDIKVYPSEGVKVTNFPKTPEYPDIPPFPKEIKVSNFPKQKEVKIPTPPKFPDTIDIKKPKWWKDVDNLPILNKITTLGLAVVKGFEQTLDKFTKADRPLAVRLSTGKDFYESGGGGGTSIGSVNINAPTVLGNGQKTVAVAGTAEVLAASTTCKSVTIKALAGNSGNVYVGDSGVTSANGFVLDNGDTVSVDIDNLDDIYLDVDTNGEGVSYIYVN